MGTHLPGEAERAVHGGEAGYPKDDAGELGEVKAELQQRIDDRIPEVGGWLRSVEDGHLRYYGCL